MDSIELPEYSIPTFSTEDKSPEENRYIDVTTIDDDSPPRNIHSVENSTPPGLLRTTPSEIVRGMSPVYYFPSK